MVQAMWMYFELVLRKEAPNPFVGDVLLFLSEIPVLAALLLQANLDQVERRKATSRVDFLLLLLWWLFLYLFLVIPWQYVAPNEGRYGWNYNQLSGCLDVVILVTIAFQWIHRSGQRRWFYTAFFGSQLLLGIAAYAANLAIDRHIYYPGSWYDLRYVAALASITIVGLAGCGLTPDKGSRGRALPLNRLGVVAVLSLPVITAGTLLVSNAPWPVVRFREFVAQVTVFVMASLLVRQAKSVTCRASTEQPGTPGSLSLRPTHWRSGPWFFDETISSDTSQIVRSYVTTQNINGRDLIFYMVDLDRLKEVNDGDGHRAGDNVLKEVTNRIAAVIRSSDILVRWGGDEFLIVSRHADRREAEVFALRILMAVGLSEIAVRGEGVAVRQTCSIGWAAFPWHPDDPKAVSIEVVLSLADRGAYEAKAAGRNRAIGVLPAKDGSLFFVAAAEDNSANYPVQITCVEGPSRAKEALAIV